MTDSIQQQLIDARRNQILDAASTVFADKGFHPTTIRDIATEAGIADGTIYNYFKNKTGVLLGIFNRMQEMVKPEDNHMDILLQADLHTFLKAFVQLPLTTLHDDDFRLLRVVVSEMLVNEQLRELYETEILQPTIAIAETYLEQWAKQHNRTDLDVALIVRTVSGTILGYMVQHMVGDSTIQARWDELPDFLVDLLFNGLEVETV